ncbi:MAG: FAD-dependent oxidoreductase [Oceanospirillaceae bacterium]|nr:FAD-dependent oxidoreductase [Oceanospirillaceae bacterium]MBT13704.1 FAD-dependent oxidoreductase [Oceanospirillaceae bacterium]|tara:strand:+ start:10119 stop:11744 length:1626 start_codon:yes stop_codon:yes gene_type:complete
MRESLSSLAQQPWDIIVIGGGITGAAVLREAARYGLKCLLLEQRDFAWGASSRSGKWVHGGLRYIKEGQLNVTWHSVHEREKLCRELPGLINMKSMHWPLFKGQIKNELMIRAGLFLYDAMAGKRWRQRVKKEQLLADFPGLQAPGLKGAVCFYEGQTDDARLTLRIIQEAQKEGATALNYTQVTQLIKENNSVCGVTVQQEGSSETFNIRAHQVIAATGAWADDLRQQIHSDTTQKLRPLRGSHLVFDQHRLPVKSTLILEHPQDKRPGFITQFQGRVIVGNTDIDHRQNMQRDASVTGQEVDYLLQTVQHYFPQYGIQRQDILATFSGVRPVVDSGADDPSKESRDHIVWYEDGLITIGGGKLTTFQHIAVDALKRIQRRFPQLRELDTGAPLLASPDHPYTLADFSVGQTERLSGRYGGALPHMIQLAGEDDLSLIPGTDTHWFELIWCARYEDVRHLDDLLLRRTRIGLLLKNGGADYFPRIRALVQTSLGWNNQQWQQEISRYQQLWKMHYSVPDSEVVQLNSAPEKRLRENQNDI